MYKIKFEEHFNVAKIDLQKYFFFLIFIAINLILFMVLKLVKVKYLNIRSFYKFFNTEQLKMNSYTSTKVVFK